MRNVKVWINDGSLYQIPHYVRADKINQYIAEWGHVLFQKCKEINADHYVYAVKTLDDDDAMVKEVDIYMTPLDDDDFYKRTEALQKQKKVIVYAWHKGTAY